jgi:hypothetical protein
MAMQMIVGPARRAADRRTPIWLAENATDYPASDGANRTSDDEPGSRSGTGADPIGAGAGRGQRNRKQRRGEENVPHLPVPQLNLTAFAPRIIAGERQDPNSTAISSVRGKRRAEFGRAAR